MGIGFPFVNLQNIFGNNVIDVTNLGKATASDSQLKDYNLLNGDVLFVRSSVKLEGVGEAALVPQNLENTTYSGFIIRFRDEYGLDNNFKRFIFGIEAVRNQIMAQATNSANKNISQTVLENLCLKIPSKSEQEKIGLYFSNLDTLITLHQCKCDNTKIIIYIAWEQRKLGEMCQITMGQSPDGSTYSEEPSDYILVQGNADLKDGWVYPRIWTTQKTKTAQAGDLIMSVRAPAGAMGKTAYDVVLGRGVAGIKGNEFVYQSLVKMDSDGYWKKMAAGSTFESINSDVVKNAEMIVPQDIEEQEKIGVYFKQLDTLITLHQQKYIFAKYVSKYAKNDILEAESASVGGSRTSFWKKEIFNMGMMTVYHGGYKAVEQPEIRKGRNTKDFGTGFYCTIIKEQAQRWARRYDTKVVSIYDVRMEADLNIKEFKEMTEEWLDFIVACRSGLSHDYDIVIGAMADDQIYNYVSDYMDGVITREQFWVLAKFKYPTHQIAFCTERSLKCLEYRDCEVL